MASKTKSKSRLVDQPPSASSSEEQEQEQEQEQVEDSQEEEEEQSGEEEEESAEESEEEEVPKAVPKPITLTPQKPRSSSESSETENGSGSDAESESGKSQPPSPSVSDFTVKPSAPVKSPAKPPAKRPQETQKAAKESKKKKAKIVEDGKVPEEKKPATPIRLWSDDDQLAILKGVVEFKDRKGLEPTADMSAFHDFVRGKFQIDVSKSQLSEKLRRLKKKFMTTLKNIGEHPAFHKSYDQTVFEYSKKIWGPGGTSNGVVTESANGKAKKSVAEVKKSSNELKKSVKVSTKPKEVNEKPKEDDKQVAAKKVVKEHVAVEGDQPQDFRSKYPHLAASFGTFDISPGYPGGANMYKENMSLIPSDKAKVLDEKWKKLHREEAELNLKRIDLIKEHYQLVLDATRGS